MKHLCTILASVFSFHLFAAPMATVDWVKEYVLKTIGNTTSPSEPQESVKSQPQAFAKTYSSDVRGEDGATYTLSLNLESAKSLALIVTDSTVEGIQKGSVYPYNAQLNSFDLPGAPISVIKERTVYVANVITNLAGVTLITSNAVTRLSATHDDGTEYWNTTWYGRDYLVSAKGMSGPKIGYVISTQESGVRSQWSGVRTNPFVLSPILSAYADDYADINAQGGSMHYCGNLYFGKIVITRKGREEECVINMSFQFNSGVGSGTVAEYTAEAFEDWYAAPKDGIYAERKKALVAKAGNFAAWGFPDGKTEINDDNANVNIRYSNLYSSDAFTRAFSDAEEWIKDEYVRIFMTMHQKLKKHSCPSLKSGEKYWKLEWGCKCRHTYPDLFSGEEVKCDFAETEQHNFQTYVLERDNLVLSEDSVGCILCARCMEHREDHGAVHVAVPENADYCGCYCGYYYEKKELDESTEEEGTEVELPGGGIYGGADVIEEIPIEQEEKVEIECTDRDGESVVMDVVVSTIKYVSVTANVNSVIIPWRHVSKTVFGANGKRIKVTTSANSLMKGEVGRVMHHKPQHPLECTCKCGVEHFFKASPCPEICRGCNMARDCFRETDGGEVWAGHTNGTNLNINVRGYHVKLEDGYWDDEAFTLKSDDGTSTDYIWNNKTGGAFYTSPYADWYFSVTTNGYAACGCACGRFYSDSTGNHGKAGRDRDGNEVDSGHHGNFHVYGLKKASDIKCPFTAFFYADDPQAVFPSCACNNRSWEEANPPSSVGGSIIDEHGWIGAFSKGKNSGSESLACEGACRWCWPYGHGVITDTELKISHHTGVGHAEEVLEDDVYKAYVGWIDSVGGLECGCLCQALKESTSAGSGGEYAFVEKWSEVVSENFHFCSWENDCLCDCGRLHFALTPETWAKYNPFTAPPAFSRCSREMGICQKCGYYDKTAVKENLNRADVHSHAFGIGCGCDCAGDGGIARFKPEGYSRAVRGWSAAQDGDNYPNNTRSASRGYKYRDDDIFERYHAGNNGHLCACNNDVGHHLYHKQDEGEKCPDCCKYSVGGHHCDHVPTYYVYNAANKGYAEKYGEHYRSPDADYCGCDCGEKIHTLDTQGKEIRWCVIPDSDCYCFGRYAPTSPYIHSEHRLCEHKHVTPTGNVITNEADCGVCLAPYPTTAHEFVCMNGHIIMGREQGTCQKNHPEKQQCRCGCCDDSSACDCPYCLGYQAADKCTCQERGSGLSDGKLKFTSPLLTATDVSEMLEQIDLNEVFDIDGDDPVYEIAADTFMFKCGGMPNLTTIKFNYCTNVETYAFAAAFRNCPLLRKVEFLRLVRAGVGAFSDAFILSNVQTLELPNLTYAAGAAFQGVGVKEIRVPYLQKIVPALSSNCATLEFFSAPLADSVGSVAFCNNPNLKQVEINGVSRIGFSDPGDDIIGYVFEGCPKLKSLDLPSIVNLDNFAQNTFRGSSLEHLRLPQISTNAYTQAWSTHVELPTGCKIYFFDGVVTVE